MNFQASERQHQWQTLDRYALGPDVQAWQYVLVRAVLLIARVAIDILQRMEDK